jgi:hypothetical protein
MRLLNEKNIIYLREDGSMKNGTSLLLKMLNILKQINEYRATNAENRTGMLTMLTIE